MSNYPIVYGYCDAGCKRRVPSYEEYSNSASVVTLTPDEKGWFFLDIGKAYKIRNVDGVTDPSYPKWEFNIAVEFSAISTLLEGNTRQSLCEVAIDLPAYDKYSDIVIKILGVEFDYDIFDGESYEKLKYTIVYELNGERYTISEVYDEEEILEGYDVDSVECNLAVRTLDLRTTALCWLINEDGTITGFPGKSAYEYAKDAGYTGSEEEFAEKMSLIGNSTVEEFKFTMKDGSIVTKRVVIV